MSEQQQPPGHGRELTVSEISAAGAPNYRGRAIHPQVQFDNKGLMYIGPIPLHTHGKRTASVPVKLVALGEQGQQQCTVCASDDDHQHLDLVVSSDPDLLRIDRRSTTSSRASTPWLTVPATNLSYVKVTVNRWQDGNEGSDVLIAALFRAEDRSKPLVLLLEVDTRHHDNISIVPPDKTPPRRLDTSFDPNALEHIKAFFLSWQQKDYCRTEIDPTRALAVPPPGQSLSSRPPIPEGYDPHDSTTWVAPFGPVSGDQEALYLDGAARKKETTAVTTTAKAATGKGRAKANVAVAQVEAGTGPRLEASTHAISAQRVAAPPPDEEPMVVITQSGRTVKPLRRDRFTSSAIDMESEDDDAVRKEPSAAVTKPKPKPRPRPKVKDKVAASTSSSGAQSIGPTAEETPPPPPPPAAAAAAAAPVVITQSGRTVKTRVVHSFLSDTDSDDTDDAVDDVEAADDFSPPPPGRGSSSSSSKTKKKKPSAKRPRVGRKGSEPVVVETTGGGGGATIQGGRVDGTEKGEQRAQKMEIDREGEEEPVMQGREVAGAATTTDSGEFAADHRRPQQQWEEVAQSVGPWSIMDRLPFTLPPLPLPLPLPSTTTAAEVAAYHQQPLPRPLQQQPFDETTMSLVDLGTTMTTRSSSRRTPGGASAAASGTALR